MAADDATGAPSRTAQDATAQNATAQDATVPSGRELVGYDDAVRACLGGMLLGRFRILDTAEFLLPGDLRYVGGQHARVLVALRTREAERVDPSWSAGLPTGMTSGRTGRVGPFEFARLVRGLPMPHDRRLGIGGALGEYAGYLRSARLRGLTPAQWPELDLTDRRRFGGVVLSVLDGRLRTVLAETATAIRRGLTGSPEPVDDIVRAALAPLHELLARRRVAAGHTGLMVNDGWGHAAQLPDETSPYWTPHSHAAALAARLRELAEDGARDRMARGAAVHGLLREYARIGAAAATAGQRHVARAEAWSRPGVSAATPATAASATQDSTVDMAHDLLADAPTVHLTHHPATARPGESRRSKGP